MNGYMILADGREVKLPHLAKWKTCHTSGEACDCFELQCPLDTTFDELLETAVRFRGEHNGQTVFFGVPDEMSFSYGEDGLVFFASGRGMAALLMDNQLGEAEYAAITLGELCRIYAEPFGVEYELGANAALTAAVTVTATASCWKVISDFTKSMAAVVPWFTKEGKMVLTRYVPEPLVITDTTGAMLTLKRYGVISQLYINGVGYIYNQDALSRGIECQKVVAATSTTGSYQVKEAGKGYFTLTVTLPEAFRAFPGDKVSLKGGMFIGEYIVDEAESSGGPGGCFCTLTLKKGG